MTQPDLFVVCKNCGSEVSPYVTECPYCGQRVRKRAPKLERSGVAEPRPKRRGRTGLPRLRPEEIEGIAPDTRPYATAALIVASLAVTIVFSAGRNLTVGDLGGIVPGGDQEVWRYFTAPFFHQNLGYQFVTLVATGVFGSMIERRFGVLPVLAVFLLAGAAGSALAVALDLRIYADTYVISGANGAALGLLAAWLVQDRRAARGGDDRGNDLIGVYAFAVVLLALSLAVEEANIAAAVGGAAAGAVLGLALPVFTRRTTF